MPAEAQSPAPLAAALERTRRAFAEAFGRPATAAAAAPGRVNLIGEHVDYADGFVLPLAIERQAVVVAAPADADAPARVRLRSTAFPDDAPEVDLERPLQRAADHDPPLPSWTNYLVGPMALARQAGLIPPACDLMIDCDVPAGGGLSSSAALEVATLTALEALTGRPLDPVERARLAQKAEHDFAGTPCGIMDQMISSCGVAGHALLIDCRTRERTPVPLPADDAAVLVINSMAPHELSGGEYAERRAQVEEAAARLGLESLRDAEPDDVSAAADAGRLDGVLLKRAQHVTQENQRTLEVARLLRDDDHANPRRLHRVGRIMHRAHESLRDLFEVSTPELDLLVELAMREADEDDGAGGGSGGVYGARMTGGGFGGCTVTLVHPEAADAVRERITAAYREQTGIEAEAFVTRAAAGAQVLARSGSGS